MEIFVKLMPKPEANFYWEQISAKQTYKDSLQELSWRFICGENIRKLLSLNIKLIYLQSLYSPCGGK